MVFLSPPFENPAAPDFSTRVREFARVIEQSHRVLSDRGSLFYFSDPGIAGPIRVILDHIFGKQNFRAEYVWMRTNLNRQLRHDTILFYGKTDAATENQVRRALREAERRYFVSAEDERGPFRKSSLEAPLERPNLCFPWRGYMPGPGRSWRYTLENLEKLFSEGRILMPAGKGRPALKQYLVDAESAGLPLGTVWDDIPVERGCGKVAAGHIPLKLAERIALIGSRPGDLVLDPYAGQGVMLEHFPLNHGHIRQRRRSSRTRQG
nr:DNA methyltransferase [Magnetospirillum sulfuroxidans]